MIKISIKDAQIGMVAAEPIKTPLGQILALPGTPLTRQLINKMKLYKVGSISIQNPFDAAAPQAGENTAKRDKVKPVPKTRAHEMVTNIQRVQALLGVEFLPSDFKKKGGYQRSIQLSKEYNLYRQNFCGCIFSKRESEERMNKQKNIEKM